MPIMPGEAYGQAVNVTPWLYRACIRQGGAPGGCSDDANVHP